MNGNNKELETFEFQPDNVVSLKNKLEKMDFLTIEEILEKYPKANEIWNKELIQEFYQGNLLVGRPNHKDAQIIEISIKSIERLMEFVESNIQKECDR